MINCSLCDHIQYTFLGNTSFSFHIYLILFAKSFNTFIFAVVSFLTLLRLPPTIMSLLPCLRRTRVAVVEFAWPPSCSLLHSLALPHTSRLICITVTNPLGPCPSHAGFEEDESGSCQVCLTLTLFSSTTGQWHDSVNDSHHHHCCARRDTLVEQPTLPAFPVTVTSL